MRPTHLNRGNDLRLLLLLLLQALEKDLAKRGNNGYLVTSHPTAADFMMGYGLIMLEEVFPTEVDLSAFPQELALSAQNSA